MYMQVFIYIIEIRDDVGIYTLSKYLCTIDIHKVI